MCLATTLGPLTLKNPLILCSGVLDMTRKSMEHLPEAGGVVTKSVGREERLGYGNPSVVEMEHGLLNAMGLPNPGVDVYVEEMRGHAIEVLIGSVFGEDQASFVQAAVKMATVAHALELNMSCPHAGSYGAGVPTPAISSLVSAVKKEVKVPVFVKLGAENIRERAEAAVAGGADGLVAINTVRAMAIDVETGQPILANRIGGYSGPAIKPIGVRCVYELAQDHSLPVIGVGGATTARDVLEYMMAGASAVQMGSALHYGGKTAFRRICDDLRSWLREHHIKSITEVIGRALPNNNL